MENEAINQFCRNCESPLPEGARYCPNCSQRNHDGRLTFREFMSDFISTIFNLDNRIFSTLRALLKPGKLTVAYFEGKQVRYYHPLRLFLISGAIFITLLGIRMDGNSFQWLAHSFKEKQTFHQKRLFYLELDSLRQATATSFKSASAQAALDSLLQKMGERYSDTKYDSMSVAISLNNDPSKDTISTEDGITITTTNVDEIQVALEDIEKMPIDSLLDAYGVKGFWSRIIARQQIRLQQKGDNFGLFLVGNVLWMMLVMMPLFALALQLFYFRQKLFYLENLIFSFHVHSFLFLWFSLLLLFAKWMDAWIGTLNFIGFMVAAIYSLFAMKRFYRQSWPKTIFKYLILGFVYFFLASFAMAGLAAFSFVFF